MQILSNKQIANVVGGYGCECVPGWVYKVVVNINGCSDICCYKSFAWGFLFSEDGPTAKKGMLRNIGVYYHCKNSPSSEFDTLAVAANKLKSIIDSNL